MAEKEILTQSAQNGAAEEEKKISTALKVVLAIINKLRSIFGKSSVIQQKYEQKLAELEDTLVDAVEQNAVTNETLDKVLELVKDLDGKIDSITPENVDEIMGEFIDGTDRIINDLDGKYVQENGKLTDKMRELLKFKAQIAPEEYVKRFGLGSTKEVLDFLSSDAFDNDFLKNAHVIQSSELRAENQLVLEYKGMVFLATAEFEENGEKPTLTVHLSDSSYTADDIKTNPVFQEVEKPQRYNAEHTLMKTFCEKNGFNYLPKRVPLKKLSPQQNFIRTHIAKAVSADNIENIIDEMGNYHIRNAETGEMLVASSDNDKIIISFYPDTENISDISGKHRVLGSWEASGDNRIHSKFVLSSVGVGVSELLRRDEMREYLEISGITKEMQDLTFAYESDTEWAKVTSEDGESKVAALYDKCQRMAILAEEANQAQGIPDTYTVKQFQSKSSTFINISDGTNTMAFAFDANGNPTTINFKDGNEKFKSVYNAQTHFPNDNYIKFKTDGRTSESFKRLYSILDAALEETRGEREITKETSEPIQEGADKERKRDNDERNRA